MYVDELKTFKISKILCENVTKIYREMHTCDKIINAIVNNLKTILHLIR